MLWRAGLDLIRLAALPTHSPALSRSSSVLTLNTEGGREGINAGDEKDAGSVPGSGRSPGGEQGEYHGQRSLVSYSPWGHKESDTTEQLSMHAPHGDTVYCVCVCVSLFCPTLGDPMDCSLPGFSIHGILQQTYWSGLPFPSPGDIPGPGIEPASPALPTSTGGFSLLWTWEASILYTSYCIFVGNSALSDPLSFHLRKQVFHSSTSFSHWALAPRVGISPPWVGTMIQTSEPPSSPG